MPLGSPMHAAPRGRQQFPGLTAPARSRNKYGKIQKTDWSVIPYIPFPLSVSSVGAYLAHALGPPGVSELLITASKPLSAYPAAPSPLLQGLPSQRAPPHAGPGFPFDSSSYFSLVGLILRVTVLCRRFLCGCW